MKTLTERVPGRLSLEFSRLQYNGKKTNAITSWLVH